MNGMGVSKDDEDLQWPAVVVKDGMATLIGAAVLESGKRYLVVPASQLAGTVAAGDRLALMLRASFQEDHYGSPEHEERCREALREWTAARGSRRAA